MIAEQTSVFSRLLKLKLVTLLVKCVSIKIIKTHNKVKAQVADFYFEKPIRTTEDVRGRKISQNETTGRLATHEMQNAK